MADDADNPLSDDALLTGAQELIETFGLGDQCSIEKSWPTDEGDRVIAAGFTGRHDGEVLLAVNAEVAARLMSDRGRLVRGLQRTVDAAIAGLVVADEVELVERRPERVVVFSDNDRTCALFGLSFDSGGANDQPMGTTLATPETSRGSGALPTSGSSEAQVLRRRSATRRASGSDDALLDVEVEVEVELGRTSMPLREVLELSAGQVIEFGRSVDFPIPLLVNGLTIGWGEVVVVGEQFGVRIVDAPDEHV